VKDGEINVVALFEHCKTSPDDMSVIDTKFKLPFKDYFAYECRLRDIREIGSEIMTKLDKIRTYLHTKVEKFNGDFFNRRIAVLTKYLPDTINDFHKCFSSNAWSTVQPLTINMNDIDLISEGKDTTELAQLITSALSELEFTQKVTIKGAS